MNLSRNMPMDSPRLIQALPHPAFLTTTAGKMLMKTFSMIIMIILTEERGIPVILIQMTEASPETMRRQIPERETIIFKGHRIPIPQKILTRFFIRHWMRITTISQ